MKIRKVRKEEPSYKEKKKMVYIDFLSIRNTL